MNEIPKCMHVGMKLLGMKLQNVELFCASKFQYGDHVVSKIQKCPFLRGIAKCSIFSVYISKMWTFVHKMWTSFVSEILKYGHLVHTIPETVTLYMENPECGPYCV